MVEIFANLSIERKKEILDEVADAIKFCYDNRFEVEAAIEYISNLIQLFKEEEKEFAQFAVVFTIEGLKDE